MAKVLIVDDSVTIRRILKSHLEPEGHEIIEAVDGADGVAKFLENKDIPLILTDVNMPKMDGLTLCERIRAEECGKSVTIFIISTEGNDEFKAKAKSLGVMAWLTKPPDPDKLKIAVNHVLKNKPK